MILLETCDAEMYKFILLNITAARANKSGVMSDTILCAILAPSQDCTFLGPMCRTMDIRLHWNSSFPDVLPKLCNQLNSQGFSKAQH